MIGRMMLILKGNAKLARWAMTLGMKFWWNKSIEGLLESHERLGILFGILELRTWGFSFVLVTGSSLGSGGRLKMS